MKLIILSALFLVPFSTSFGQNLNSRIGVINSLSDRTACLMIRNSRLKKGDKIKVVLPDEPQKVIFASIKWRIQTKCSSEIDDFEHASFYRLQIPKIESPFYGFGIASSASIHVNRGIARTDLNGDGKSQYFRSCTATEGIHLSVWTGKPLIGKRIWHAYHYLGYDTEPSCKKKTTKALITRNSFPSNTTFLKRIL
jgi:hypothetical protein